MTSTMMRPTAGLNAASTGRNAGSAPQLPSRAAFARGTVRVPRQAGPQLQQSISTICKASNEKSGLPAFAEAVGLPTEEGLFGFKPFPELWVGRLAMMGFLTSMIEEAITGRGTLGQIGLTTPDSTLLAVIAGGATVATLVGTANTINNARTGKLSLRDLARYKQFLGMRGEEAAIAQSQKSMKLDGDFTTPGDDSAAIAASRAEGTPADAFLAPEDGGQLAAASDALRSDSSILSLDNREVAAAAAAAAKVREARSAGPSVSLSARDDVLETAEFTSDDWAYAKKVELSQGRWAMLGFLVAILVEAGTGNGILGQLVVYAKSSGLLGVQSGF